MGVDEDRGMGIHITKYTGSITGPNFNNDKQCDDVTPIAWQVDHKCHVISASALCKLLSPDTKAQPGVKKCGDDCDGSIGREENGCASCGPQTRILQWKDPIHSLFRSKLYVEVAIKYCQRLCRTGFARTRILPMPPRIMLFR